MVPVFILCIGLFAIVAFGILMLHQPHKIPALRAVVAEFVGTAMFQYIGGMCSAVGGVNSALGNGLALMVCVYGTANVSGGHLNPAVSIAMAVTRREKWQKMGMYVLAQLAGAAVGAGMIWAILETAPADLGGGDAVARGSATLGTLTENTSNAAPGQAVGIEAMGTFVLVWVIFATSVDPRGKKDFGATAPLAIGLTLTCNAISHGDLTGCSINPARSFGPALVFSRWQYHWVYWLGPCTGALAAAALQSLAMIEREDEDPHSKQGINSSLKQQLGPDLSGPSLGMGGSSSSSSPYTQAGGGTLRTPLAGGAAAPSSGDL